MEKRFRELNPAELEIPYRHQVLISSIAPRPIAFISTVDKEGHVNLAPFSFFNVFGANPPLLILAPNRGGKTGHLKDTIQNLMETFEGVINVVTYSIVGQMNVASSPYPRGVDEFTKAGLTPIPSVIVKPPRVKESPIHIEVKVREILLTGTRGGAANLVLCEPLLIHVDESVLDKDGLPDPYKLDLVARMGKSYYARVQGEAIFTLEAPTSSQNIGWDQLPQTIKESPVLTGNDISQLALLPALPTEEELTAFYEKEGKKLLETHNTMEAIHRKAQQMIREGNPEAALKLLILAGEK